MVHRSNHQVYPVYRPLQFPLRLCDVFCDALRLWLLGSRKFFAVPNGLVRGISVDPNINHPCDSYKPNSFLAKSSQLAADCDFRNGDVDRDIDPLFAARPASRIHNVAPALLALGHTHLIWLCRTDPSCEDVAVREEPVAALDRGTIVPDEHQVLAFEPLARVVQIGSFGAAERPERAVEARSRRLADVIVVDAFDAVREDDHWRAG